MISNDGVIGVIFVFLAVIILIVISAVVIFSFDLTALLPAEFRISEQAANRSFSSGMFVAVPGSPNGDQIPYPMVNIGKAQTVFPQPPLLPAG